MTEKTQIEKAEVNLDPNTQKETQRFSDYLKEVEKLTDSAYKIKVTSVDQVDKMKEAKELRLMIKKIRCETEVARKEAKESIVLAGRAIDGGAAMVKKLATEAEAYLELQEKYIQIMEEKAREELKAARIEELKKFDVTPDFYDLGSMSNSAYDQLLENSRIAYEVKQKEIKAAEDKRIADEKARVEREKQMAEENERLRAEAAKKKKEEEIKNAALEEERKANEEKLRKAQEKADKAEAALKAKRLADQKAKELEEKQKREEELKKLKEAEKLRLAPDREKIADIYKKVDAFARNLLADYSIENEETIEIVVNLRSEILDANAKFAQKAKAIFKKD